MQRENPIDGLLTYKNIILNIRIFGYALQQILYRPMSPGLLGISNNLIKQQLTKNPVGLLNILGKYTSPFETA